MSPTCHRLSTGYTLLRRFWLLLASAAFVHAAAENDSRSFDIAADHAERALKLFSEQAGCGVIFVTDAVQGLKTNPVKGRFTRAEALAILLRDTGLVGSLDPETGAFAIRRTQPAAPKNA